MSLENTSKFITAVKESDMPARHKRTVVGDFKAVNTDTRVQELNAYYDELLNLVNIDIMVQKHPNFKQFFKTL